MFPAFFRHRGMLLRGMAPEDVAEIVEVPSSQVLSFLGEDLQDVDPAADATDATPTSGQLRLGSRKMHRGKLRLVEGWGSVESFPMLSIYHLVI